MTTGIVLAAHGSRREIANREVSDLAAQLQQRLGETVQVRAGFLELTEPSIDASLRELLNAGCREVTVLPYFLAAGRHVAEDIPAIVAEVQRDYPEHPLRVQTHLGAWDGMVDLLAAQAVAR